MSFFPEGNTVLSTDDEQRTAQKLNQILFDANGNVGSVPFPEGTEPKTGDDLQRSLVKIVAIKATL
jgi:hypothetical protein